MDVQTSNRIYDEIALTVGMRLIDDGATMTEADVAVLATDVDRDAGTDQACSIGRLVLDTGDMPAIQRALEMQQDRVRSVIARRAPNDPAFCAVQRQDMDEAKLRQDLIEAWLANDRMRMEGAYRRLMALHVTRR